MLVARQRAAKLSALCLKPRASERLVLSNSLSCQAPREYICPDFVLGPSHALMNKLQRFVTKRVDELDAPGKLTFYPR